jgi:hypothetical protein
MAIRFLPFSQMKVDQKLVACVSCLYKPGPESARLGCLAFTRFAYSDGIDYDNAMMPVIVSDSSLYRSSQPPPPGRHGSRLYACLYSTA